VERVWLRVLCSKVELRGALSEHVAGELSDLVGSSKSRELGDFLHQLDPAPDGRVSPLNAT
jgi:hypothetical protein